MQLQREGWYLRHDEFVNDSSLSVVDCDLMRGNVDGRRLVTGSARPRHRRPELRLRRRGFAAGIGRE